MGKAPSYTAPGRSSAATSGSIPTTSIIATDGPIISRRSSITSSIGNTWRRCTLQNSKILIFTLRLRCKWCLPEPFWASGKHRKSCSSGHAGCEEGPALSAGQFLLFRLVPAVGPFFLFLGPLGLCLKPVLQGPLGHIVDLGRR